MHSGDRPEPLVLAAGAIKSFVFAECAQLHIVRGCIWLTISGVADDYWLADGDRLDLPLNRRIVIEAHKTDSVVKVMKAGQACGNKPVVGNIACVES